MKIIKYKSETKDICLKLMKNKLLIVIVMNLNEYLEQCTYQHLIYISTNYSELTTLTLYQSYCRPFTFKINKVFVADIKYAKYDKYISYSMLTIVVAKVGIGQN